MARHVILAGNESAPLSNESVTLSNESSMLNTPTALKSHGLDHDYQMPGVQQGTPKAAAWAV